MSEDDNRSRRRKESVSSTNTSLTRTSSNSTSNFSSQRSSLNSTVPRTSDGSSTGRKQESKNPLEQLISELNSVPLTSATKEFVDLGDSIIDFSPNSVASFFTPDNIGATTEASTFKPDAHWIERDDGIDHTQEKSQIHQEFLGIIDKIQNDKTPSQVRLDCLKQLTDVGFLWHLNEEFQNIDIVKIARTAELAYEHEFKLMLGELIKNSQESVKEFKKSTEAGKNAGLKSIVENIPKMLEMLRQSNGNFTQSKDYQVFLKILSTHIVRNPEFHSNFEDINSWNSFREEIIEAFPELNEEQYRYTYGDANIFSFETLRSSSSKPLIQENLVLFGRMASMFSEFKPLLSSEKFKADICDDLNTIVKIYKDSLDQKNMNVDSIKNLLSIVQSKITEHLKKNNDKDELLSPLNNCLNIMANTEITLERISHLEGLTDNLKSFNPSVDKPNRSFR